MWKMLSPFCIFYSTLKSVRFWSSDLWCYDFWRPRCRFVSVLSLKFFQGKNYDGSLIFIELLKLVQDIVLAAILRHGDKTKLVRFASKNWVHINWSLARYLLLPTHNSLVLLNKNHPTAKSPNQRSMKIFHWNFM